MAMDSLTPAHVEATAGPVYGASPVLPEPLWLRHVNIYVPRRTRAVSKFWQINDCRFNPAQT